MILSTIFRPAERVLELPETVDVETPGTFQVKPSINQPVTQLDSTVLTPVVTLTCDPVRSPKNKVTQCKLKVIKGTLYDEVCMRPSGSLLRPSTVNLVCLPRIWCRNCSEYTSMMEVCSTLGGLRMFQNFEG